MDEILFILLVIALAVFAAHLYSRIQELKESLQSLKERVEFLEAGKAEKNAAPPSKAVSHDSVAPIHAAPPPQAPAAPAFVPPPLPPMPAPAPPPVQKPKPAPAAWSPKDMEALVGGNWLAKLGVVAIAIAMAFFLQYAFSRGLISPTMQVAAGLATSAIMIGAGQFLFGKKTYRNYAQIVISGGVMVYFLSIYAAYNFYNPSIIGYPAAFAALAIGAIAASALALKNDSEAVALLCALGAFGAPVLIRSDGGGSAPPYSLYAYLMFLNLWVFALVRRRNWNSLAGLGLGATWLLFFGAGSYQGRGWATEGVAALFLMFSCYQGMQLLSAYAKSPDYSETEEPPASVALGLGMILGGCLSFGIASASILLRASLLAFSDVAFAGMALTLVLVWLSNALPRIGRWDKGARLLFGYLASAAFVSLIWVALNNSRPVSRAYAPSAFVFSVATYALFLGVSLMAFRRTKTPEIAVPLAVANAFVHLSMSYLALDTVALWNVSALALWLPIAGWAGALGLIGAAKPPQGESDFSKALVILAHLFSLGGMVASFGGGASLLGATLFAMEFLLISGTWIAFGKQIAWERFRADRLALFANAVIFCGFLASASARAPYHGVVPLAAWVAGMAAYHAFVGGVVLRKQGAETLDRLLYYGVAATLAAVATSLQLKGSVVTLAWATESVGLVFAGLKAREARVRAYGLTLLGFAIAKSLALDAVAPLNGFALFWNPRFLSGASVVIASYLCAFAYWKERKNVALSEEGVFGGLCLAAHALTLVFGSCDLWQYAELHWSGAGRANAPQLSLSIFWAAYAFGGVCFGIARRNRQTRMFSMGLLYFSVLKVFVFDLSGLEGVYRIASFFTLGVILLLASLLYTRFEAQMRGEALPIDGSD